MTDVVVVMAWRPQPARLAGHEHVVAWYREHLPGVRLLEVDTPHVPYNLAAVRNAGMRQAQHWGAEIVVLTDADARLADPAPLLAAIRGAADGRMHMPFTAQRYLTDVETAHVLRGGRVSREGGHGNGAIHVIAPDAYWTACGSDERFSGWGGDDDGFVAACSTLIGLERHPGTVWSLWHADECRPIGTEAHRPNAELAQRYWDAHGDRAAMLRLIGER